MIGPGTAGRSTKVPKVARPRLSIPLPRALGATEGFTLLPGSSIESGGNIYVEHESIILQQK